MVLLIGFLSGILGGMGMGGGTALIPLLRMMGVDQKAAQGVNLISFVPMAILAVYLHNKNGLIVKRNYWEIVIPAVLFAVAGTFVARVLASAFLSRAFGAFLFALSLWSVVSEAKAKD